MGTVTLTPLETWAAILGIAAVLFVGVRWLDRWAERGVREHVERALGPDPEDYYPTEQEWEDFQRMLDDERREGEDHL